MYLFLYIVTLKLIHISLHVCFVDTKSVLSAFYNMSDGKMCYKSSTDVSIIGNQRVYNIMHTTY